MFLFKSVMETNCHETHGKNITITIRDLEPDLEIKFMLIHCSVKL